jgi:glycosyltransferase involved in cell wall biosynthesis
MKKKRLAIVTTHPIQYNAPLFQLLTERDQIAVKVFYTWGKSVLENKYDPGFGKIIDWDIPLLEGYDYEFLENVSDDKGSHRFRGIINPDIISRIDAFGPDAVLVFGWSFVSHMKVLRHYSKHKMVIFRGDSTLLDKSNYLKDRIRLATLKWVYVFVDFALYVGTHNLNYFKKAGLLDEQLIYAPHAIDNKRFNENEGADEEKAAVLRASLNIANDRIVFLFAGKLEEKKNVRSLLIAFEKSGLSAKTDLIIVGNGRLEDTLKRDFAQKPGIHFLDFKNQSEMPAIYRMADVFVLPSTGPGETWGLALNEAMACSRAVISSDKSGGAVDLVDDGVNGYIFRGGDIEDLIKKLCMMAGKTKKELQRMGAEARDKIKHFTLEKFCEATEKLITNNLVQAK